MSRIDRREIKLFVLIILPLAIAALGMLWSTSIMLDGVSDSVNKQEETRTWQAVQSAFGAAEAQIAGTMTDNAHWDEAANQSYGAIDDNWMYDTWGVGSADINYDTMFLVDARGKDITSYHYGEKFPVLAADYLGKALALTLDSLPKDNSTFEAISSLVNTPNGLAVMAAAPILPTSEDIKIAGERPNYLIFVRSFTKAALARMGEQYIVDGLDVLQVANPEPGANLLRDRWGTTVAVASWQARHPGDAARNSYRSSALATILALIGVMFPISIVHGLAVKKMDLNEKTALLAARMDSLSGLPNRVFLLEELAKQLATARKSELALIFVDLDGFKAVNDAYDHETGDKLIRAVAAGLFSLVANEGILARLGGDEFAVLIGGPNAAARTEALAANVLAFVKDPFDIDGRIANIGASIGIAELGEETLEPAELMRRADIAMYDAKEGGRNRWRRFDGKLDLQRSEEVSIANELRAFIARGVFDVAYQPMVNSRDRTIIGVEALARWPKSSGRSLAPDRFIPVAEEHGLIDGLGALIMRIAFRDIVQWQDLRLAINISPLQINNPNLVPEIMRTANEYGLALNRLEVEFTETVLIKSPVRAKHVIQELQGSGVTVALDDFGTGYASVGYLREYGFDKIKIDRSLTQAISQNVATQQVVQGTILIAKGLSADIIAEGIETEEEAQLMRLAGCQQLQGYYFGRPGTADTIGNLLAPEGVEPVRVSA